MKNLAAGLTPEARRTAVMVGVLASTVLLTGCGPTFEQRIEQRKQCEATGGTYDEWRDGFGTGYITDCNLARDDS